MNQAQNCFNECHDMSEAFVYCTLNAVKCDVVPFFDTYSAPFFKFSDNSIVEFVIDYSREVISAKPYHDLLDLVENGERFAA